MIEAQISYKGENNGSEYNGYRAHYFVEVVEVTHFIHPNIKGQSTTSEYLDKNIHVVVNTSAEYVALSLMIVL